MIAGARTLMRRSSLATRRLTPTERKAACRRTRTQRGRTRARSRRCKGFIRLIRPYGCKTDQRSDHDGCALVNSDRGNTHCRRETSVESVTSIAMAMLTHLIARQEMESHVAAIPPALGRPTPMPTPLREHQDHRHLPIGTRIYRGPRGDVYYVYPGRPVPPEVRKLPPIVIVVP